MSRSTITHLEADHTRPTLWVLLSVCRGLGVELSTCLHQAKRVLNESRRGSKQYFEAHVVKSTLAKHRNHK